MERDEYLNAVTIGEREPHNAQVELVDYDEEWPELYRHEEEKIRAALGERALSVEHVGSPAVPGLPAKPVLDINLEVAETTDEDAYVPPLEAAGYVLRIREPEWFEHRLFKGPGANINLHTFSAGCPEIERMLAFRDRLREHDEERIRYEDTKRELASR